MIARLGRWLGALAPTLRQVAGMPDYARYLEHAAEAHPGGAVQSEREFFEEYLTRRTEGGPTRCC